MTKPNRCPFRHYVSNRTGLNLEKDLDTSDCRPGDCKGCGWNPSVEEARKRKIQKAEWSYTGAIMDAKSGEVILNRDDLLALVMNGKIKAKVLRYICTATQEVRREGST